MRHAIALVALVAASSSCGGGFGMAADDAGGPAATDASADDGDGDDATGSMDDGTDESGGVDDGPIIPDFECGDGVVEGAEECDLGNLNGTGMYCRSDCKANTCPDGYTGPGEACDDGNVDDSDECTNACGPASCGDGILQPRFGEQCDNGPGNALEGGCLPSCIVAVCNDGLVWQGMEVCDGNIVPGATCASLGHSGGALLCNDTCNGYNESNCFDCGDGNINPSEQCDGGNLGPHTCQSIGYTAGQLLCAGNCQLDTSQCTLCPNGVLESGEACDTRAFPGSADTCEDNGFGPGMLSCTASCDIDTSNCNPCGNGVIDGAEACDGTVPGAISCVSQGWTGGTIACTESCTLDTSGCCQTAGSVCDGAMMTCCGGMNLVCDLNGPFCCLPMGTPCTAATASQCCTGACGAGSSCT